MIKDSQKGQDENINNGIKYESFTGHPPIPLSLINEAKKSICKVIINTNIGLVMGTGFFMKIYNSRRYLITNNHVISSDLDNQDIEIEIYNHKKFELNLNNRIIKFFPKPKDITLIEIKSDDKIYNDIKFLYYDLNYKFGYEAYKNESVFSIQYPLGEESACASGQIININNYEFDHNISTNNGSSGCPIILLNSNINLIRVIGIHKNANYIKNLNSGTFIGEIFKNDEEENKNQSNNKNDDNKIFAVLFVSVDGCINYPITCKNSDYFYELEEKLYNEYPELKKRNICFIANGCLINRLITVKENKIFAGSTILISFYDEE